MRKFSCSSNILHIFLTYYKFDARNRRLPIKNIRHWKQYTASSALHKEKEIFIMLLHQEHNPTDTLTYNSMPVLKDSDQTLNVKLAALEIQVGALRDPGLRRRHKPNEDTILVIDGAIPSLSSAVAAQPFALLGVADGMGGQAHGQEASQLALQSLLEYLSRHLLSRYIPHKSLSGLLSASTQYANQVIYERNRQQQTTMGTTMTVALISENTACIAHVGDSRLYLYRPSSGLMQITHDHSVVAAFVEAGIIAPDEIYTHPRRNQIYRSLGSEANVEVDIYSVSLTGNDTLLLCSDGLWEMVRDPEIATIVASPAPTPLATAHALLEAALTGGGTDNVSAIVAHIS